jgi:hypothetical protein
MLIAPGKKSAQVSNVETGRPPGDPLMFGPGSAAYFFISFFISFFFISIFFAGMAFFFMAL